MVAKKTLYVIFDKSIEDYLEDVDGALLYFDNPKQVIKYVLTNNISQDDILIVEL